MRKCLAHQLSSVLNKTGIGIIVLAAGASSRMGQAKQRLRYAGETLLQRSLRAAIETECRPVIVVLGSQAESLQGEINAAAAEVRVVVNDVWAEGMSASIRCGVRALEAEAADEIEAAVLLLCDQPFVTSDALNRLVKVYEEQRAPLVASEYEAGGEMTRGVPALFSRALFSELMKLDGAAGAKQIITHHADEAVFVAMPEAAFDVDTPDDYRDLQNRLA